MRDAADEIERLREVERRYVPPMQVKEPAVSDIVDRLRGAVRGDLHSSTELMAESADEIERLRELVEAQAKDANRLCDENEQLRSNWDERFRRNSQDPSYSSRRTDGTGRT